MKIKSFIALSYIQPHTAPVTRGVPCIYVGPLCFKLRVQEKETKSEQNNGRKLSSNGEIKSAKSSK